MCRGILGNDLSDHGFTSSFDIPWSDWSCITNLDPDHCKETHPQIHKHSLHPQQSHNMHKNTVPLKSKLTVPQALILKPRDSILDSFESRVSSLEDRGSSIELRGEKVNELVAWLISQEINCTNGLPVLRAIVRLSLAITKMSATDTIVNTDKGTRVFSCDVYAN